MLTIPLQAVPSQTVNVNLNNQSCTINVYQKGPGGPFGPNMYLDLLVNDALIIGGVLCRNLKAIVISAYLGFVGDLTFYDTQGTSNPTYAGLGSRFVLNYLAPSDLPGGLA
jgi:hypothetical protein